MKSYFGFIVLGLILGFMLFPSLRSSSPVASAPSATASSSKQQSEGTQVSPAATTFTVNSTLDTPDANPGNGVCNDGSGNCTLRAAIMEANALLGTDTINFDIAPAGPKTITVTPGSALPPISETLIINGTTQGGFSGTPIIEVHAPGTLPPMLAVQASNCTIRGLVLNGIDGNAISLIGNNNRVLGCFIGTDFSGNNPGPGNAGAGVAVFGSGGVIGGTGAGEPNVIAFNGRGVLVSSGTGNSILSNSITRNTMLGIDLNGDGPTPNDGCDVDNGPNGLQNSPAMTGAQSTGTLIAIQGTFNSVASSVYRIEFFANTICHPTGFGEGQRFIGSTNVTTDAGCNATFDVNFTVAVPAGQFVTATATDAANNTSEFSPCIPAVAASCTITCPANITKSNDPNQCGAVITYPPPTTLGTCGAVNCSPTSGSFFPRGTTIVTCTTAAGPSCQFSVTINDTQPPTITCPSNVMTTTANPAGTTVNYPPPTASDNCPGVVANCNPPSGSNFPIGVTPVMCTATDASGNTANCGFTVTVTLVMCAITCPANVSRTNDPNQCGAVVTYPDVITSGTCGTVTCSPGKGSFFPVGTTVVTCTAEAGPTCQFNVTVVDNTPPVVTCPAAIVTTLPPGQSSAQVNYPNATGTDNCPGPTVQCTPPSGSVFPAGTTFVTCTGTDDSSNMAICQFSVTVRDVEAPVVRCPSNVVVDVPSNQCSAVVSYPAATVIDNVPGAIVACSPASGTSFPVGVTTVTCTATDVAGNRTNCTFTVTLTGGTIQAVVSPASVDIRAVNVLSSKNKKRVKTGEFSILNSGCGALRLVFKSIKRVTDQNKLSNADDTAFFSIFARAPDGSPTGPNLMGQQVTIDPGVSNQRTFIVRFAPSIPAVTGKTTGLSAVDVLPNNFQSVLSFDGTDRTVTFNATVRTGVALIDPVNPQNPAVATLCRSGNQFIVRYWLYDSDKSDVKSVKYEFLDSSGNVVAVIDNVDLSGPLNQSPLVNGQSFNVENAFSGANDNSGVTKVRVTVSGGNSTDTVTSGTVQSNCGSASQLLWSSQQITLRLPGVKLDVQKP